MTSLRDHRDPVRDKRDAALDTARAALRVIALPCGDETPLEARMRQAAQIALHRIDILLSTSPWPAAATLVEPPAATLAVTIPRDNDDAAWKRACL